MDLPKVWNIHEEGNEEVRSEVEFQKLLFALSERTNENLQDITVFRFFALIQHLKESAKN